MVRSALHAGTVVRMASTELFTDDELSPDQGVPHLNTGDQVSASAMPLAARMRPRTLDEFVGQSHAVGPGTPLRRMLEKGELPSLILWGPPGVGKTSLAAVIAGCVDAVFTEVSAVTSGVKDVRRIIDEGRTRLSMRNRRTVLFVDEIHRFNTAQQDALLPGVESGWVTLVGATTENPYFEVTAPLMSRCQLVRLEPLNADDIRALIDRACRDVSGLNGAVELTEDAVDHLVEVSDGDARAALSALDAAASTIETGDDQATIDAATLALATRRFRYDKFADGHYDQVSAFIKSMRGSDPDAAVYWLLRMLESGEDPKFLARRMVIFASEDIGLADRQALPTAVAAFEALDRVGLPEARYALVHAALALAVAPKSNSVARALSVGLHLVGTKGNLDVPAHLRDGHYRGAADLGHGVGYEYPHDHESGFVPHQQYLPDALTGMRVYEPTSHGHEAPVSQRVESLREQARMARASDNPRTQRKERSP